jgi:hypothetical protein
MRTLRKFTDEQEAATVRAEALMTRARIMERGVAAILNAGDYVSAADIIIAASVLGESAGLRVQCEQERAAIRKVQANPQRVHARRRRPA